MEDMEKSLLDFDCDPNDFGIGGPGHLAFPHKDPSLSLTNPYSKVTCLIMYLYSMELGTP